MAQKKRIFIGNSYILSFALILVFTVAFTLPVSAQTTWTQINLKEGNVFWAIIHAEGMFIAVGGVDEVTKRAMIWTSTNGTKWIERTSPAYYNLYAITYGAGKFVAVGYHGIIITSPDGISWTQRVGYTPDGKSLTSVAYNGSVFAAGGIDGIVRTSPDGRTWTTRSTGTTREFRGMCAHDGMFLSSTSGGYAYRSTNGSSWIGVSVGPENFYSAVYGGGQFVIGGQDGACYTSPDGISWEKQTTPSTNYLMDIIYTGSLYIACGNSDDQSALGSQIITSPDAVTWTRRTTPDDSTLRGLANSNTKAISVGSRRLIIGSDLEVGTGGGSITVTSPNGGEKWMSGEVYDVTWTNLGAGDNVRIEYSDNNGASYHTIISTTSNDGSHTWDIPTTLNSATCIIRISEVDGKANDVSDEVFTVESPSTLSVDRTTFNFAYVVEGIIPGAQSLGIINTGGGVLNWDVTSDVAWVISNPSAGTGDAYVDISVAPAGLAVGTYTGTLTVSDPDSTNKTVTVAVNLMVKEASGDEEPFGDFSTPTGELTVSGSIPVTGWALDDIELVQVAIYYNEGSYVGKAVFVEGARPDIETAYPTYPYCSRAGWGYMLLTNSLPDGTYTFYAVAEDNAGHSVKLGESTVIIDNAGAVKPFGAIDYPPQGGDAEGNRYVNWGWALTPRPAKIPIDGSTITVWVDGVSLGNVYEYNVPNLPVAALFPDYRNTNGPTGYLHIDTTVYTNGVHTISWTVADDAGNTEGIGSRYFNIRNTGDTSSAAAAGEQADTPKRKLNIQRGIYSQVSQAADIPVSNASLRIRRGYDAQPEVPGISDGQTAVVTMKEDQRIELLLNNGSPFFNCTGYMVVGDALRPLPIGSSMDIENGIFYWQAGPGFLGTYQFVFIGVDENGTALKKTVQFRIDPKF